MIFTTALLVGLSGALMPGPLTAVTMEHAFRRGYLAAPLITLGHASLEVVMVLLLLLGLGHYLALPSVAGIAGMAGGLVLAWMGWKMIGGAARGAVSLDVGGGEIPGAGSAYWDGMITTACNPYWFLWWATVGAGYVALSSNNGLMGVLFFFCGHILADLLWLFFLSALLVSGKKWFTDRIYRWIILGLGLFLCVFSIYFFRSGLQIYRGCGF